MDRNGAEAFGDAALKRRLVTADVSSVAARLTAPTERKALRY